MSAGAGGRRRRWLGTWSAVWLAGAVAVLSVVTGIANIWTPATTFGPVPPEIQQLAAFTGTLTGFLMLASVLALRRGLRAGWRATLVLLPVTAAQGLVQSNLLALPLIVLSVASFLVVVLNRGQFDRKLTLSTTQLAAGIALLGVQVYGTVGTYALREWFDGVDTLLDAFYYTIVTASTVGYGDVTPATQLARLFAMSVVVAGTASFAVALGALLGPAIEARFARALGRMTDSQLELLQDHLVILGYGDLTEPIIQELEESDVDFVVVTADQASAQELTARGLQVITADPSDEEPLRRGQLADARAVLAATNDDARDALAVLTARELRPDATIVAAATERENVAKLRRAGADTVISPAVIGGHLLVHSALGGTDSERIAERIVGDTESFAGQ